jgi:hypothetical protein
VLAYARYVGRVDGLAVALGIGVGLAAAPWAASATPSSSGAPATDSSSTSAATSPSGGNISVSVNGVTHRPKGSSALARCTLSEPSRRLRGIRSIDEVRYVAQYGEHLKDLISARLGPSWMGHEVADAHASPADQRGSAFVS